MQSFVNCLPFVYDYFEDTYNDNTCTCIDKKSYYILEQSFRGI